MFARHALHGLRTLVSCPPELRSRHPSNKLAWLYEGRGIQVTLPGDFHLCNMLSVFAVSQRPMRMHCSAVVMSHHRREMPSQTCGIETVAKNLMAPFSKLFPNRVLSTRWLHMARVCVSATRGPHNGVSRGMADRPSSQIVADDDTSFLENLRLCREYAPHRFMAQVASTCTTHQEEH